MFMSRGPNRNIGTYKVDTRAQSFTQQQGVCLRHKKAIACFLKKDMQLDFHEVSAKKYLPCKRTCAGLLRAITPGQADIWSIFL